MALTGTLGRFVKLRLKPGHAAERPAFAVLLDDVPLTATRELWGDQASDSDDIRARLAARDITATTPPRAHRRRPATYDATSYKGRHLMENSFMDTKQLRGVATRFVKLALMFKGPLDLVA